MPAEQKQRAVQENERPPWNFDIQDRIVVDRSRGKVWHKSSWGQRFRHAEKARQQRAGSVSYKVEAPGRQAGASDPGSGPVYVRRHTHTHSRPDTVGHTHKTMLIRSWRAGMPGGPPVAANYGAFCKELGQQVAAIDQTLACLKAKCQRLKVEEIQHLPPSEDTAVLRAAVRDSVADQINFYQRCMTLWTGLTPEKQLKFMSAMTTALQRWQEWSLEERETFLHLFSNAAAEH